MANRIVRFFTIYKPPMEYPVSVNDENNPPEGVNPLLWVKVCRMEEALKSLVTREEFNPIRLIVYGFVGAVMCGFMTGLVALVWNVARS